jgi:hypothetical protein
MVQTMSSALISYEMRGGGQDIVNTTEKLTPIFVFINGSKHTPQRLNGLFEFADLLLDGCPRLLGLGR